MPGYCLYGNGRGFMRKKDRKPLSLKWGISIATIVCWILPIIIVTVTAAVFINYYYVCIGLQAFCFLLLKK